MATPGPHHKVPQCSNDIYFLGVLWPGVKVILWKKSWLQLSLLQSPGRRPPQEGRSMYHGAPPRGEATPAAEKGQVHQNGGTHKVDQGSNQAPICLFTRLDESTALLKERGSIGKLEGQDSLLFKSCRPDWWHLPRHRATELLCWWRHKLTLGVLIGHPRFIHCSQFHCSLQFTDINICKINGK